MQKAFDLIVERLEELKKIEEERPDSCDENGFGDGEDIYDDGRSQGRYEQTVRIMKIVNQVAEEYNKNIEKSYISRTEVLKLIEDIKCDDSVPKNYGTLLDIMRQIREMPTVSVNDGWIPCSSGKMPNMNQTVLVTVAKECVLNEEVITVDYDEEYMQYFEDGSFLAWQPLPTAYVKGE